MDNRFFLLPFQFDTHELATDLATCEAQQWTEHFNKNDFAGDWTGIALRSASGMASDIVAAAPHAFIDTPLLALCPYFSKILDHFEFPIETVRLLALAPGSVIKEHRDIGLGYEYGCFRLHIPINTDDGVSFMVDGCRLPMEAGHCWYANFSLPHSVQHGGTTRRIHLVIDGLRNEWTDNLFREIGYDFDLEGQGKEYDLATQTGMLKQLRLMDTDVARAIIATLESSHPASGKLSLDIPEKADPLPEEGWIPTAIQNNDGGLVFNWMQLGEKTFTEPFFNETLHTTKRFKLNQSNSVRCSSLGQLIEMAQRTNSIAPTAFIFHVSRCGSTLLSQVLCTDAQNIVLSEVPLLDTLLRLSFHDASISQETIDQAFVSTVRLLGRKTNSAAQNLFIKTDCWHVFFYDTLRRLFPKTPFILLYRRPDEVLRSQQKQRGLQSIPSTLEPALTGIQDDVSNYADLDGYFLQLLEKIFTCFVKIKARDTNAFLINYNTGQRGMIDTLEKAIGFRFSSDTIQKMEDRGRFHAKKPFEQYHKEAPGVYNTDKLERLLVLYDQLERM